MTCLTKHALHRTSVTGHWSALRKGGQGKGGGNVTKRTDSGRCQPGGPLTPADVNQGQQDHRYQVTQLSEAPSHSGSVCSLAGCSAGYPQLGAILDAPA